jgi:signal transduction histidine kinase
MNLRWRLTAFYGVVSALILLIGGGALYFSLRASLYSLLDESLRGAAMSVAGRFGEPGRRGRGDDTDTPPMRRPDGLRPRLPGDTSLTVFDANGKAVSGLDDSPINAPLEPGVRSVSGYRVLTLRLPNGSTIQTARSEEDALGALERTRGLLVLGLPLLLALGLGAGYWLADRALKPVDAVTRLAAGIAASGRGGERVPQAIGNDEMARLTRTVNAMLEKLETLIEQERAFALAAAHELRTPLAILQGRVSLSLERERTNDQYRTALETVGSTTLKLTALVEGLLTLARSHVPAQSVRVDLADIALEVSESHAAEARERGQHLELELESAVVHGDAASLRLALSNLIRNAIRYGREGGRITIRSAAHGTHSILEVRDDGTGVGEEDLERLRRPFQRGTGLQAISGSGLGLALVDAVAHQHGGTLELGRAAEGGFRATIRLPSA